ncbi:MAG: alpha-L-glutamate ligase-like protein [Myxococcota bacterium]
MTPWARLRERGVLGINARNIAFTLGENPRHLYPLVDDKLRTKGLCKAAGIAVADVLATADNHAAVEGLADTLEGRSDFVLKPARGAMGNGILVLGEAFEGGWLDAHDRPVKAAELRYHAESVISGLYALGGQPDVAFAEERLFVTEAFDPIVYRGVPDIRVIVYRGVPVMAMTRLPTRRSGGKANLHQGAVGAGIDLESGRTTHAMIGTRSVQDHPDTGQAIVGFPIPCFDEALATALLATDQTGLGYVGADIVVDRTRGPMILELNARPGLAIQLANRSGLRSRLEAIRTRTAAGLDFEDRLALGRALARGAT